MGTAREFRQMIYDMLMKSQFWAPEIMLEYQQSQLAQLLHHARATVPFYKTRLDCLFKGNGEVDWDQWQEVPIVSRADLRDRRDEMLAGELPFGHGPTSMYYSSGSSGIPIAVQVTRLWGQANRAAAQRFHELQGITTAKSSATISKTTESGEPLRNEYYFKKRGKPPAVPKSGPRELVLNRNLREGHKLDLLEANDIAYLFDIPNNIEVLARANLKRKPPVQLEVISCFGQGLSVDQRNLFRESFGARSNSIYSSQEGGLIGFQCGDSLYYHLNPEIVLVEILDANGRTCRIGEPGRVVITPFFSTALPLIRYEQGDTAELFPPCACDSRLPLIGNISGRQDQFMRFPDGIRSATGLSQKLIRECLNALAFQLAQVETYKVEFRFVPADPGRKIEPGPIVAHVRELIHPDLDVVFKHVDKIPLNPGGKHQRIVCEIST